MSFNPRSIKALFPIFSHHPELVYLDNAATSQKPASVIQAMTAFYEKENANIHRGLYSLSTNATGHYEEVRKKVASLIGSTDSDSIVFTKGATESISIVARGFIRSHLNTGDNIVISGMEHHANLIPWQQICKEKGAFLKIIPVDASGNLDLSNLDSLLNTRTRLLAMTHISNVLGTINPIEEIISRAHVKNIPVLMDAAQSAGHYPIDINPFDADFIVFSAHKMFGPLGTGVLYSKKSYRNQIEPLHYGGGAIKNVEYANTEFLDYPHNLEAGTPNISGVIGLGAAIDFIESLDKKATVDHTNELTIYFKEKVKSLTHITLLGNPQKSGSIVSFQAKDIHPHDVASFLANADIAVRAGHHCAQPLLESMGVPAVVRISFAIYNTKEDLERTIEALVDVKKFWS